MKSSKLLSLVIPLIFVTYIYTSAGAQSFRRDGKYNTVNLAHFVVNPSHRLRLLPTLAGALQEKIVRVPVSIKPQQTIYHKKA